MERASDKNFTAWLRCRLDRGMFSDEVVVTYPPDADDDKQMSVFVEATYVRHTGEHRGEVKVAVVDLGSRRYAALPTAERNDYVFVEDSDLVQQ